MAADPRQAGKAATMRARPSSSDRLAGVPAPLAAEFIAAGHHYGIPPAVLAGVATIESGMGANRGPSSAGAIGLMQFEPGTAHGLGIDPSNDRQAIWGAAKYLTQLGYQRDPVHALSSYNAGPAASGAARAQGNGYAAKVMAAARTIAGGKITAPSGGAGAGGTRAGAGTSGDGAASSSDGGSIGQRALEALVTFTVLTAGAALAYIGLRETLAGGGYQGAPA